MIVSCPSCQTRYRHQQATAGADAAVQCSECEEQFEPRPTRGYVLLPQAARRPIGMDDPQLADQIRGDATDSFDRPESDLPAAPADLTQPVAGETEAWESAVAEAAPPRGFGVGAVLATTLVAGVGGVLAYYLAVSRQADPITWTAVGATIGLVLGWCCLQWTQSKD